MNSIWFTFLFCSLSRDPGYNMVKVTNMQKSSEALNPYVLGTPVTNTKMIFGRNGIFRWLMANLGPEYPGKSLIIWSKPGIGKSTVIHQISNRILGSSHTVISLDAEQLVADSPTDFFWRLVSTTSKALGKQSLSSPEIEKPMLILSPERIFNRDFWEPLHEEHNGRQFIIAIDNLERLITDQPGNEALSLMRRNLWRLTIDHENVNLILALSGRPELYSKESFAPFDASLSYQLRKLRASECHELFNIPEMYDVPIYVSEFIHHLTGGHPADLQRIGHAIFERMESLNLRRVTLADILAVLSGAFQPSDFYSPVYSIREEISIVFSPSSRRFEFVNDGQAT
jgi:hypothetical protein